MGIESQEDLVLSMGMDLKEWKRQLKDVENHTKTVINKIQQKINSLKYTKGGNLRILGTERQEKLKQLQGQLAQQQQILRNKQLQHAKVLQHSNRSIDAQTKKLQQLKNAAKRSQGSFEAWALGVMFFGMAMQRVFTQVWKTSSKTFQDVMHSTKGTVTGFDKLEGGMKFLQYAVGAALEPIAEFLAPIVFWLAEAVQNNEGWVRTILVSIGAIGTFLFLVGTLTLGISSLIGMYKRWKYWITVLKALNISGWLKKLKVGQDALTKSKKASLGVTLSSIAAWAALIALFLLAVALLISIKFTWKQVVDGWIIKIKLLVSYFKTFFLSIQKGILNIKFGFIALGQKIKITMVEAMSSMAQAIAPIFNKIIGVVNRALKAAANAPDAFVPKWLEEYKPIGEIVVDSFDTSGMKKELDRTLTDWYNAYDALSNKQEDLVKDRRELFREGAANEADAIENFKRGWTDLLNSLKGKQQEAVGAILPSDLTDTRAGDTTTTVDNSVNTINIAPQGADESMEDFAARILETMQRA